MLPKLSHLYAMTALGDEPRLWIPFVPAASEIRPFGGFNFAVIGRLRDGKAASTALADLNGIQTSIVETLPPGIGRGLQAAVIPLQEQISGRARAALLIVLGAVALVLFIACVNVASMLAARGIQQQRDTAIRRAAGASHGRLLRQLLTEGVVMSALGGVAGVAIAVALLRGIVTSAPVDIPRLEDVTLDGRVLLFTLGLTWLTGLTIVLPRAWHLIRHEPAEGLSAFTRGATPGQSARSSRALLIGLEVGVSTVCLILAGLLLASFVRLVAVDPGFASERLLTVRLNLPVARYPTSADAVAFQDLLRDRLRVVPGVSSATLAERLPIGGQTSYDGLIPEGTTLQPDARPAANVIGTDESFFTTLGIPLLRGRTFDAADRDRRLVAVMSRATAERAWPGADPIGKRFRIGLSADQRPIEVIGVVGDVRVVSLDEEPPMSVYLPYWQRPVPNLKVALRTTGGQATAAALRQAIYGIDPQLAIPPTLTMDDLIAASVESRRFQLFLVVLLAAVAAALAGLGIYGLLAYSVTLRRKEIGIRMAVGARAGRVRLLVLGQSVVPVLGGIGGGMVVAAALGRLVRGQLFDIAPTDPTTFAGVALLLVSLSLAASYIPVRRATRIDPVVALRAE